MATVWARVEARNVVEAGPGPDLFSVELEDGFAPANVRLRHVHVLVEPPLETIDNEGRSEGEERI